MKLLIQQDLHWVSKYDPSNTREERENVKEFFRELKKMAASISLWGKYEITDDGIDFCITAQKVTVDEYVMNELFSDFFSELFELSIRYAWLGGAGCDFAIELEKAVPRGQYVPPENGIVPDQTF